MKTLFVKPADLERRWYLIDAEGKTLGRLASRVVTILRGKNKPTWSPHWDTGDSVIIVNAAKVVVTGRKPAQKLSYRHSGDPGGFRTEPFGKLIVRRPTVPLEHAIRGMLPKGPLGRKMFQHVKVYPGPQHPHAAQKPIKLDLA